MDRQDFYQQVIDKLFDNSADITLADVLDAKNYILPTRQEVTDLENAKLGGSLLSEAQVAVDIAQQVSEKALYIFGLQTDLYTAKVEDNSSEAAKKQAAEEVLDRLITIAREVEDGKPVAIPNPTIAVAEAQSDGGVSYVFKLSDFGIFEGDNVDVVIITELPGRHDVKPLRPDAAGNPVPATSISYDDFGDLYLNGEKVVAGQEISRADIEGDNLVFKPSKHFDRTASFKFQLKDADAEGGAKASEIVSLFITIKKQENDVYLYNHELYDAQGFKLENGVYIPPEQDTEAVENGETKNVKKESFARPVEILAQDSAIPEDGWFAFQALADDPDTGDSFAEITYALKEGDDADLFNINTKTGKVTFKKAPDFENPHDGTLDDNGVRPDADNTYEFTVVATGGDGSTAEQKVHLTVQDRNDEVEQSEVRNDSFIRLEKGVYLEVVGDDGAGWSAINGDDPRTMESWVRINNPASDGETTVLLAYGSADESKDTNGKEGEWFILEVNGDGLLQLNTNIGNVRETFTATHDKIDDNAWYHVAVTYGDGTLTIWLNQQAVLSQKMDLNTTDAARLRLGDSTHLFAGDGHKNGSVDFDNFRVWDKALSVEELIASSRIHKYGSSDLNDAVAKEGDSNQDNKDNFQGVENLALEYSFDRLKNTSDLLDNSGHGRNARLGKLGEEQTDVLAATISDYLKGDDEGDNPANTSAELAVVVEGSHLVLSNEMFGISDIDDANEGVKFHLAPVDGKLRIHDGKTWVDSADNIFTLGDLKAGHVRFVHDGSENPTIQIQYSVYDGLAGGSGADIFVLDKSDSGTDIITDFSVSDGDKIRIDTANGSRDDTIAELNRAGYYIRDNTTHTNITNADNSHIYLTINDLDHNDITDSSFGSYFEII